MDPQKDADETGDLVLGVSEEDAGGSGEDWSERPVRTNIRNIQ
jgi:hypothetical protein